MSHNVAENVLSEVVCVGRPGSLAELDAEGYLAANPDVRRAGMPAAAHFESFGQAEGRLQWENMAEVAAMRDRKLARLRFRRATSVARAPGAPADFLSPAIRAEFAIPERPPVSANDYGYAGIDGVPEGPGLLFLDVGAGLRRVVRENVVNTEIYPSASTDVLCVGEDLPFADAQFDVVFCLAVLEHTRRPWAVAREICRVLKPGGTVLVDYPFLQGVHGYPHHYFNATPQGAASLFAPWCDIRSSAINANNHPIHAIWWLLESWRSGLGEADRDAFAALRVADILAMPPDAHLAQGYCAGLDPAIQRVIAAGSTLTAVRTATRMPHPWVEALRGLYAGLRHSMMWKKGTLR